MDNPIITQNEKQISKTEMLKILIDLIRLVGEPNLNYSDLERKYGFTRKTLRVWVGNLLKDVPPEELAKERAKAYHSFIGMDTEIGRLKARNRDNPDLMSKLIETERKVYESKCKVWESFGLKDVTPERVDNTLKITIEKVKDGGKV